MNYTLLPPIVQSDISGIFFGGCTQESAQMHTMRIKLSLMREGMRFMKKYIDNVKPE